jgi:hypothetical protein
VPVPEAEVLQVGRLLLALQHAQGLLEAERQHGLSAWDEVRRRRSLRVELRQRCADEAQALQRRRDRALGLGGLRERRARSN